MREKSAQWVFLLGSFTLLFEVALLEIFDILFSDIWALFAVSGVLFAFGFGNLVYLYLKNKPKVKKLREEYLEDLKPKVPLRYCASDDKLLSAYKKRESGQDESEIKKYIYTPQEDDELEM